MARLRSVRHSAARSSRGNPATPTRTPPRTLASAAKGAKAKRTYQVNSPSRSGRLNAAMRDHQQGMSLRNASYVYNVKRSTLADACKRKVIRNPGRANELSDQEEQAIVDHLLCQSDWGFPLTRLEVSMLVKSYLDCKGVVSKRFKENTPGRKWMSGFLQRHPQLHHQPPSAKINKGSACKSRSGNSK